MIDWTKETSGGKNYCGNCEGAHPDSKCDGSCFQEGAENYRENREDQIKRKAHYHKYKLMCYSFDKNDWAHFHDCILNATWKTTKISLSQEQMEKLFMELPKDMQFNAFKWGMNDTPWREDLFKWYQKNKM